MRNNEVSNILKPIKKLELNLMQMTAILANQRYGIKNINIEAGRGSGKSTVLGWFLKEAARQMPRSTGVIVGETFVQIKTRTLPSTKEGLEMFGLFEGIDYIVGRCGQKEGFEMPFQAPDSWANVIHFRNGTIAVMVSLDNPNSGRGLNSYFVIGDEAALLTYEHLYNNVLTTNRSIKPQFKNKTLLNSTIFVSSVAMTQKGEWFTNREEKARKNPKKFAFLKFTSLVNKHNLTPGWIEQMKEEALSKVLFDAEIMNIRPRGVTDGFYSQLKADTHYYSYRYNVDDMGGLSEDYKPSCRYDTDLIRGIPLQFNLDFGGRINCGTVSQYLTSINEVRFIKEFFVKNPDKLSDMVRLFIDYYEPHKSSCNVVHLYHDRSGYKQEANSKTTLAEDVENMLRSAGWRVINKTPNTNNPSHIDKFRLINEILSEQNNKLPIVRINENQCPNLIISMENAPLTSDDAFKKDKSSERSSTIPQEHATHFSDTFDYCLFWQFSYIIDYQYSNSFIITNLP
ncbi:hypothetical protein [Riemerella columbipharyngis]|uniref:Uncharacterized protein n=1 Tax=Riemerella columbipharyngis TaxID=1071918 RepID=A0A1G7EXZ0_9FLAO|nr:hypothetical protein [Riemerella columbipharyngis]SDE68235.1 hypothetical protein SAMN05421544_1187 [Riemerella columbipharyngis]